MSVSGGSAPEKMIRSLSTSTGGTRGGASLAMTQRRAIEQRRGAAGREARARRGWPETSWREPVVSRTGTTGCDRSGVPHRDRRCQRGSCQLRSDVKGPLSYPARASNPRTFPEAAIPYPLGPGASPPPSPRPPPRCLSRGSSSSFVYLYITVSTLLPPCKKDAGRRQGPLSHSRRLPRGLVSGNTASLPRAICGMPLCRPRLTTRRSLLIKLHHPDKVNQGSQDEVIAATKRFQQLVEAYTVRRR